jgi:hypothetical protein
MAKARAAPQDTLIGSVSRQRREEIRVSVRQVQGVRWLDLRIFYESETGEMKPSQRGVSLSPNEWKELRSVLQKLHREKEGRPSADTPDRPSD